MPWFDLNLAPQVLFLDVVYFLVRCILVRISAERNPGKLFKAGIIKPESSPRDTMPEALFATRAFWRLFSKNVSPSSLLA